MIALISTLPRLPQERTSATRIATTRLLLRSHLSKEQTSMDTRRENLTCMVP